MGEKFCLERASPPPMHSQDGGGHMRDLGIHLLYPLLKSRALTDRWSTFPLMGIPSLNSVSLYQHPQHRVQGATKTSKSCLFQVLHLKCCLFFSPEMRVTYGRSMQFFGVVWQRSVIKANYFSCAMLWYYASKMLLE